MGRAPKINWQDMEQDWRAGIKSGQQLADEYGVTRPAIVKHWKKLGIERDLAGRIRVAAQKKVSDIELKVTAAQKKIADKYLMMRANDPPAVTKDVVPGTVKTEAEVIESNANSCAAVVLEHRMDIKKKRALVSKLFEEVRDLTEGQRLVEQIEKALKGRRNSKKLAEVVKRISGLPGRVKLTSDLISSYRTVIELERKAFGLDTAVGGEMSIFSDDGNEQKSIVVKFVSATGEKIG